MKDEIETARNLRKNQTDAEKKLWLFLRNRQLTGLKFRRQFPIKNCVVDFCCFEEKLVIEVDGGQHSVATHQDQERTSVIEKEGYRILRFWNHDVLQNIESVLISIKKAIKSPSPQPSPSRERK